MKYIQHSLLKVLLLCACFTSAQSTISASGGDASGSGGSMAYSLGQVVYNTYSNNDFIWSQGVQQAYEVSTLSVSTPNLEGTLTAYPNPTMHQITLDVENFKGQDWSYTLFDLQGRLLKSASIKSSHTSINMSQFLPATYLIVIRDQEQKNLKTFKIIKR